MKLSEEENEDSEMYDFIADVVVTVSDDENQFLIDLDVDDDSSSSGESERNEESENDIECKRPLNIQEEWRVPRPVNILLSGEVETYTTKNSPYGQEVPR